MIDETLFTENLEHLECHGFLLIGLTQLNNQEYSEALEDKLQQHVE